MALNLAVVVNVVLLASFTSSTFVSSGDRCEARRCSGNRACREYGKQRRCFDLRKPGASCGKEFDVCSWKHSECHLTSTGGGNPKKVCLISRAIGQTCMGWYDICKDGSCRKNGPNGRRRCFKMRWLGQTCSAWYQICQEGRCRNLGNGVKRCGFAPRFLGESCDKWFQRCQGSYCGVIRGKRICVNRNGKVPIFLRKKPSTVRRSRPPPTPKKRPDKKPRTPRETPAGSSPKRPRSFLPRSPAPRPMPRSFKPKKRSNGSVDAGRMPPKARNNAPRKSPVERKKPQAGQRGGPSATRDAAPRRKSPKPPSPPKNRAIRGGNAGRKSLAVRNNGPNTSRVQTKKQQPVKKATGQGGGLFLPPSGRRNPRCDLKCRPCYKPDVVCVQCVVDLKAKKNCNPCSRGEDGMTGDEYCAAVTKNTDYKCCSPSSPCMRKGGVIDRRTADDFNSQSMVCAKSCGWRCDKPKPISELPCTISSAVPFKPRPGDDDDGDADDDDENVSALSLYLCDSI